MDRVAVIIPCYNEAKTIQKVISDFKAVLPEATIYVYDNNSTDGTDILARKAGASVRYAYQQGKGNVIRQMFREIDAECYVMVDGDDTYPAEVARMMVDKVLEKNTAMVLGDRLSTTYFVENKRPFHNVGNRVVRTSVNILFKNNIQDIMTGYRALSYEFVKTFPVLSRGFEVETEMSIHAIDKNLLIESVAIDYRDRPEGSVSKLDTYSDGYKVMRTIVKFFMTYKPLAFWRGVALLLTVIAAFFFVPIMKTYIETGLVPDFPTLIVCGFTMLAAVLSFFVGITLETFMQKNRQDFEMLFLSAANEKKKFTRHSE